MSNNSDIGWLDKSKVDATLRNLKDRKRVRRRTADIDSDKTDTPEEFVDLFGVSQPSPIQSKPSDSPSYIKPTDPVAEQTTAPAVPAASAASVAPTTTAASTADTTQPVPTAHTGSPSVTSDVSADRRTTAPTTTLGATQDIPTIPSASAQAPPQRVTTTAFNQRAAERLTATLETTPIVAHEPDDEPTAAQDLSDRFKDAFDVLRSSDSSRPIPRSDTKEIRPLSTEQSTPVSEELSLEHTTASSSDHSQDLSLQSTGQDQIPQPASRDDLQLHDVEPSTPFRSQPTDAAQSDDDDAISLPAHDLDLSIQTAASPIKAFEQTLGPDSSSEDIVFDAEDFSDEQSTSQSLTAQYLDEMQLPSSQTRRDAPAEQQPSSDHTTPEHAFVPKIHSQILKTVRLRNAPDPAGFGTLYQWFEAVHEWIRTTETSATQFLVADHAGLSLMDTGIDETTISHAVAVRRSLEELRSAVEQKPSGFTVFRHHENSYLNLVWALSEHGTITMGILSDHVYPDERLATFEEKLVRGIDTLPFV